MGWLKSNLGQKMMFIVRKRGKGESGIIHVGQVAQWVLKNLEVKHNE
jgi:hypothetical protein